MICLNTQKQMLEYQSCSFTLKYLLSSKLRDIHAEPNLVLTQMPSYAKFMKDILSRRRKLRDMFETIMMTEECSAILQKKLPQKAKDLGSFTILVDIEGLSVAEALCDLGASINLMPLSMFRRLQLGEVTPTMISLQMADRSIKTPYGIVEDVLVRVDKFVFPVDFVILDMEEDSKVPLILGRPFLVTGRALIDVEQGIVHLRVAGDMVTFNVYKDMKHPKTSEDMFICEVVDELVCKEYLRIAMKDPLEVVIMEGLGEDELEFENMLNFNDENLNKTISQLESVSSLSAKRIWKEDLRRDESSSSEEKEELKPLPSSLKYAFLEEGENKPVIVSSTLTSLEEEKLLRVLRGHKKALG